MDADEVTKLANALRAKAVELLDEARELYHEAAREKGETSDERLILADRSLLLVRSLFVSTTEIDPEAAREITKGVDDMASAFRGAAKLHGRPGAEETLAAFGERLRRHREFARKSQTDVGREIGQRNGGNTGSIVSKWESGRRLPDLHNLLRLCRALDVPLEALVYGDAATER